jgi:hypothetical protein
VEQDDPVTALVVGGSVGVPPPLPSGTEHSLTDLDGIGSEPKVATVHENVPLRTLNTNVSAAPKATFVAEATEQDSPILQIVTYPSGRFFAAKAVEVTANNAQPKINFLFINIPSLNV